MKKILVATDGAPSALHAIELALELAAEHDSTLVFVYVAPSTEVLPVSGIGMAPVSVPHELDEHDRAPLEEALRMADEHDVAATTKLLAGDPAHEIVTYADLVDADLIVVGSRGRGALTGAILGSVSRGVMHGAKRPVLIVRDLRERVEALV
jgi:nucleotide-binding universal stress UspA family protein